MSIFRNKIKTFFFLLVLSFSSYADMYSIRLTSALLIESGDILGPGDVHFYLNEIRNENEFYTGGIRIKDNVIQFFDDLHPYIQIKGKLIVCDDLNPNIELKIKLTEADGLLYMFNREFMAFSAKINSNEISNIASFKIPHAGNYVEVLIEKIAPSTDMPAREFEQKSLIVQELINSIKDGNLEASSANVHDDDQALSKARTNTVRFKNFKKEILQLEGAYQYEELVQLYNHTLSISSYHTITANAGVDQEYYAVNNPDQLFIEE